MKTSRSGILLRVILAGVMVATPVTAAIAQDQQREISSQSDGQRAKSSLTVPISGAVRPEANPAVSSPLTGTFAIQRFARSGNGIVAIGTLTASFTDPVTNAARTIVTQAALPLDRQASAGSQAPAAEADDVPVHGPAVAMQAAACDILHLVLGPLDLNLLGLRIQLNQVVLDITAIPGAGNLLGNLLCAIVGLLDGPGPLGQLLGLLNQLLAILG